MFYDRFVYLCEQKGISPSRAAIEAGLSKSLVTKWKVNAVEIPSADAINKLTAYFNVSIDYLIGRESVGEKSEIFRQNLATIIENADRENLIASGVNLYEANLIIDGAIPLSFDMAWELCDQLGEDLHSMMGINSKTPTLTKKDERDIARDVERIMEDLSGSGELMFDGVPMSEEAKAAMAAAMRIGFEEARRRNKATYTPKKYREE